ncbi:MAG: hypothetical protein QG575_243 [Euryarchaeota archaeon]|nr:hypothetical protein [Euryarchaeota archaeon]
MKISFDLWGHQASGFRGSHHTVLMLTIISAMIFERCYWLFLDYVLDLGKS